MSYYLLGVLAPTFGALHQCLHQGSPAEDEAVLRWIQYFLLLCTLHSVVFPVFLKPLSFVMPSWFTALLQTSVVMALATPKLGLTTNIYNWCSTHYIEYLVTIASILDSHALKPLKKHVTAIVDRLHSTKDASVPGNRRGEKEL